MLHLWVVLLFGLLVRIGAIKHYSIGVELGGRGCFCQWQCQLFSQDLISKPLRSHNVVVSWWWYGHPNPVTGPWDLLIYSIIIIALISVFGIFGSHWTASARLKLGSPKSIRYTI